VTEDAEDLAPDRADALEPLPDGAADAGTDGGAEDGGAEDGGGDGGCGCRMAA
jgi:hypothetical protein